MSVNDYDAMAADYSADNENNAWNALYERPAILAMAGDVAGKRVLDAGCGAGAHSEALLAGGADVEGCDLSAGMLRQARRRLGERVTLKQVDLTQPLPYADNQFDMILSSLALHYLEDWSQPLGEFHRILRDDGRLVFSTHHPFMDHAQSGGVDYFATYTFEEAWQRGDQTVTMRFWHRPLVAMLRAIAQAGFHIEQIDEPMPLAQAREKFPDAWRKLTTAPRFLFFALRKA